MEIRKATFTDIEWLKEELLNFDKSIEKKYPLYSSDKYIEDGLLNLVEHHVVLIAIDDDFEPLGFIAGFVTPHFFNPEIKVLTELFWWVSEQHRGTRAGLVLLNAFIQKGKDIESNWIIMTLESGSPVREETITKRGFKPQETNYLMEV